MGGYAPRKELSTTLKRKQSPIAEGQVHHDGETERNAQAEGQEQESKRKKTRRAGGRGHDSVGQRKKNVLHHDVKVYEEAERNEVRFDLFSLIEQMPARSALTALDESQWVHWEDSSSRAALDRDGIPVFYHFPKFLLEADIEKYTNPCIRAGEKITLTLGGPEDGNGKSSHVMGGGGVSGLVDFAIAVAPETKDQLVVPSPSLLDNLEPLKALMTDTEFLSERIDHLVSLIDPAFYDGLELLKETISGYPDVQKLVAINPTLMEGRSIAFNQKTPLETNDGDFEAGWRVLVSLGSFTEGGYVRIPRLGLRVRFLPGDVLVLRGAFLEYEVETWSGGQKVCLEHFTRGDLWRHAGVEL